jgi:hypothetical protein
VAYPTAPRSDAERAETARDIAAIAALLSTPHGIRDVAMALRGLADSLDTLVAAAPLRPRDLCDMLAVRDPTQR